MAVKSPVETVRDYNPALADAFMALRKAAVTGPLDETACELIIVGALATTGEEASFRVHARRLRKLGVDAAALRQAVMSTLAATTSFAQVVAAIRWIDAIYAEET